jgi:hypothetical protein
MTVRWIDSFLFNGDPIVKLRLQYLAPHVDRFYVCEQRYTYQGERKAILYTEFYDEWFEPYRDKVTIVIDETAPESNAWKNEYKHRNYMKPYLLKEPGPWICTIADCDEIPDARVVTQERQTLYERASMGPVYFQQDTFYYNLQWFMEVIRRAFCVTDKLLATNPATLQDYRDKKVQPGGFLLCGWHLSYCMSKEDIRRKLKSFAHTEYSGEEWANLKHIQECIEKGVDLFRRTSVPFQRRPVVQFPPEFIAFHTALVASQS